MHYKYLIIGGGMTADSAVKGIREQDKTGSIGLFSKEPNPPYNRPPLTKALWKGKPLDSIWRSTTDLNAGLHLNTNVETIDTKDKIISTGGGKEYTYDKLLIATGGTTIKLPFGKDDIIYYRTVEDYKKVRELADKSETFAVIGGGFIGSELAAALCMNGKQVTMLFPDDYLCQRIFPKEIAEYVTQYYRDKGVEILSGETVTGIESNSKKKLILKSGKTIEADVIIGGIGIKPDIFLAENTGINTDNGITVNEYLETNIKDIYSAGDAANFYNPALDKRMRVEHEDNANKMGKQAGEIMAGNKKPYTHLPFFYSDLFDLGYEAVGELDSRLDTFADWKEKFKAGVIYYLKDKMVRGVLLWNTWSQVENAREIIAGKKKYPQDSVNSENELKGLLPKKKEN